jgi:DUF971 family protein
MARGSSNLRDGEVAFHMSIPQEIKPAGDRAMAILWEDGVTTTLSFRDLRKKCPCATCRKMREELAEKPQQGRYSLRLISEDSPPEDPILVKVDWVGNYAIKLTWADGHDTGMYPFELLEEIAQSSQDGDQER